jgi:hypothetical protein
MFSTDEEPLLHQMKRPNWWVRAGAAVGALLLASSFGVAQEMVLPTHEVPAPEVAAEALRSDQPRTGLVKLGPFDITPRVSSTLYYDDNIETDETDEIEDMVFTLAPTITGVARDIADGVGKQMSLSYTPFFYVYFDENDLNRVDHFASVAGSVSGVKLTLGFEQYYRRTTDPVIDIGTRADRSAYDTVLSSQYLVTEKTSIEINGSLNVVDYDDEIYNGSWSVANDDWVNYQYSPKLGLGLGVVIGYQSIDNSPDQTYQQGLARVTYAIAEKVNLSARLGGEWRQFKGGADDSLTPVWSVGAAYRPRDSTTLSLRLFQEYRSSARDGGSSYVYTGASLRIRQMLMQRLALNLAGTYSNLDYESTVSGGQTDRNDDLFLFRASLDVYIRPRWTVGVFYDFQTRDSTNPQLEFDRNRVGLQTAWSY